MNTTKTDIAGAEDPARRALRHAARKAPFLVGVLPSTFRAAVSGVTMDRQQYRRSAYVIDSRHARLRVREAPGSRKSEIRPCPDPQRIDPWAVDPSSLPGQTLAVTVCPTCRGDKKVACVPCSGAGKRVCGSCHGGGQVMGQRGPKNCPACRGKGTQRCDDCHGQGRSKCRTCDGRGRVRAWLEIEHGQRVEVRAHPKAGIARLHPGLEDPRDLDREPTSVPVPLVSDTGWGKDLPEGLGPKLLPTFDVRTDRIVSRRLQVFESDVHHCRYRLATGSAQVQVSARPLEILEESEWRPWRRRRYLALGVGGLVLLATLVYRGAFTGRAEWFMQHDGADLIAWLGALSAVLAALATGGLCLPKTAWGWGRVHLPALAVLGIWVSMWLLWIGIQPSTDGVHASIERDDLESAHREIAALEAVGVDDPESLAAAMGALEAREAELERQRRRSLDEAHLERVEHAERTLSAIVELERPWEFEDARAAAARMVLARAREDVERLFQRNDCRGLDAHADALASHDEELAARARARQRLCEAHVCRSNGEWSCVVTALGELEPVEGDSDLDQALARVRDGAREGLAARLVADAEVGGDLSLDQQRQLLERRLADARIYIALTGQEPPVRISELEKEIASVERRLEARRARQAARQRRDARRTARAEKRAEERRARAEARAARRADRVECCDGTTSPSCRYSQGSLRGCCSWHGGVC